MKKKTIIALIVAAICIVLGGILLALGLFYAGGPKDMVSHTEKTYVVSQPFENIHVEATVCDMILQKTDGEFRAVCPDYKTLDYSVLVEGDTLYLRQVDLRQWYDLVGVELKYQQITLYLPESQYNTLQIETSTGDVALGDMTLESCSVRTTTGDITLENITCGDLRCESSTGDKRLRGITADSVRCVSTTGYLTLESVVCQTLDCESSTGDQRLRDAVAAASIGCNSSTGKVTLLGCDAPMLTIETSTGDVEGMLLSPKEFFTDTGTGDISLADHSDPVQGKCYVTTGTGDITFSYQP